MNRLERLRQARAKLIADARSMLDKAEAEQRDLKPDEVTQYDALMAQVSTKDSEIRREEQLAQAEARDLEPQRQAMRPVPNDAAHIGMTTREANRYSLVRAIRAAVNSDWRGAELEREASEATAQRLGRQPNGSFFVPADWLERRDLTVGTATAGGNTVQTNLLAQNFIDLLRNRMALQRAGVTVLSGLVGPIAIPRQSGGATAYWVAENTAVTESAQTFDQVTMTPKTVGGFTDIARRLLLQSSIDVEALVRTDLATVLALAIDVAGLHGPGSGNQPTGLAATSGIGSVAGGTNGLIPTWGNIVDLETKITAANADIGRLAYISNAKVRGKLKQAPVVSGYPAMIWGADPNPVNGYPVVTSNQISSTLTKGSSSGICSAIFFGNWADLFIGMWGGLDILVDPYTGSTAGTVRVVALQDVDIAVRHPESFSAMLDALTT